MTNSTETIAHAETRRVIETIDVDHLEDRLEGRGGGLRTSKPDTDADDGLTQYVWRMAAFHSGRDTSMPVTAAWWLSAWLEDQGIEANVSGVTDPAGEEITDALDAVAHEVLNRLGEDTTGAARRWKGLI